MIEFPTRDGVRFVKNVTVPMADGVQLALDLHVPCANDSTDWRDTPRPLLLEYIPYRKDDVQPYSGMQDYFARHGICTGVLNGTRRNSLRDPEPMIAGEVYELEFDLDATAWRFPQGHCIRLTVCSADFPNLWPTPYRGTNRLFRDAAHPSVLSLPLVSVRDGAKDGALPADEIDYGEGLEVSVYGLAPDEPVWQILRDVLGNRLGLQILRRQTDRISDMVEVTNASKLEAWASNDRPADCIANGHHHRRIVRDDGVYVIDSGCILRSTETAFHLTINLHITVNDLPHYQRRWGRTFERKLL